MRTVGTVERQLRIGFSPRAGEQYTDPRMDAEISGCPFFRRHFAYRVVVKGITISVSSEIGAPSAR